MAAEVTFQDDGLQKLLKDLWDNVDDIKKRRKPVVGIMSAVIFQDIIDHFNKEQGSEGKWEKWSREYAILQAKRGYSRKLQMTGHLKGNFKPTSYRTSSEGVTWFNNAKTKSGAPYAYYHNEGKSPNPKREFMWLSDKAMSKLEEQLVSYLLETHT